MFGEVIKGKSIVRRIENHPTADGDVPTVPFSIAACGVLSPDDPSLKEEATATAGGMSTILTLGEAFAEETGIQTRMKTIRTMTTTILKIPRLPSRLRLT